jgi:hypothetical protein
MMHGYHREVVKIRLVPIGLVGFFMKNKLMLFCCLDRPQKYGQSNRLASTIVCASIHSIVHLSLGVTFFSARLLS